ncbi:MAG: hypothetical protein ABSE89_01425 [Sedimentisphaerales bacterium]
MAFHKQFELALDNLFKQRTHWLRHNLWLKKPGKLPKFDREKVDKGITKLQELASKAFSRSLAKEYFKKRVKQKKYWKIKGYGTDNKRTLFKQWYKKLKKKGCVYLIQRGKKYLYVGRTDTSGDRPQDHFIKKWFPNKGRITIFKIKGRSYIPQIECLAVHYFQPSENKNTPATKKRKKPCPLCKIHESIKKELRNIFSFKKPRTKRR